MIRKILHSSPMSSVDISKLFCLKSYHNNRDIPWLQWSSRVISCAVFNLFSFEASFHRKKLSLLIKNLVQLAILSYHESIRFRFRLIWPKKRDKKANRKACIKVNSLTIWMELLLKHMTGCLTNFSITSFFGERREGREEAPTPSSAPARSLQFPVPCAKFGANDWNNNKHIRASSRRESGNINVNMRRFRSRVIRRSRFNSDPFTATFRCEKTVARRPWNGISASR